MASHRAQDSDSKFDSALEQRLNEVRALLRSGRTHDAKIRYRIGLIVHDLQTQPAKYGEQVVAKLAERLGGELSETSLYDAGRVAELWEEHEFLRLIEREAADGFSLSFSHFVILSRVARHERDRLLDLVMEAGLSTGALREHLQRTKEEAKAQIDADDEEDPGTTSAIHDLLRMSATAIEHHERLSVSLRAIEGLSPEIKELVDELAAAERAFRVASEKVEQQLLSLIKEDRASARAA